MRKDNRTPPAIAAKFNQNGWQYAQVNQPPKIQKSHSFFEIILIIAMIGLILYGLNQCGMSPSDLIAWIVSFF